MHPPFDNVKIIINYLRVLKFDYQYVFIISFHFWRFTSNNCLNIMVFVWSHHNVVNGLKYQNSSKKCDQKAIYAKTVTKVLQN